MGCWEVGLWHQPVGTMPVIFVGHFSRYRACLPEKGAPTHQINFDTPLKLAFDAIKRF